MCTRVRTCRAGIATTAFFVFFYIIILNSIRGRTRRVSGAAERSGGEDGSDKSFQGKRPNRPRSTTIYRIAFKYAYRPCKTRRIREDERTRYWYYDTRSKRAYGLHTYIWMYLHTTSDRLGGAMANLTRLKFLTLRSRRVYGVYRTRDPESEIIPDRFGNTRIGVKKTTVWLICGDRTKNVAVSIGGTFVSVVRFGFRKIIREIQLRVRNLNTSAGHKWYCYISIIVTWKSNPKPNIEDSRHTVDNTTPWKNTAGNSSTFRPIIIEKVPSNDHIICKNGWH